MKKQALVVALLALAGFAATSAQAATVTFTGSITAPTCTPSGGPRGNGDIPVTLPKVGTTAFVPGIAGNVAGATGYNVTVGTTANPCPATSVIGIHYSANGNVNANGKLNNSTAAGSSNVQVQVLHNGAPVDLFLGPDVSPVTGGGVITIPFSAQYFASTGITPTVGTVSTAVNYDVTYN